MWESPVFWIFLLFKLLQLTSEQEKSDFLDIWASNLLSD